MYLPWNASKARLREAENARKNRAEIVRAFSHGQISRRELIKWGLISAGGMLLPMNGLSPFARSAYADSNIPTGAPASPLFGVNPFSQPMPRFDVLPRMPLYQPDGVTCNLDHEPTHMSYTPADYPDAPLRPVAAALGGGWGPLEGRPPGQIWAHQGWEDFHPKIAIEVNQLGARSNNVYNPQVASSLNSGINQSHEFRATFHSGLPTQSENAFWTYNGTFPPKLAMIRYGEPVLFRHHNGLSPDVTINGGFGRHTLTTHKHNAHHGAENDGFTGAFFFPGQYYDYHWPITLAGFKSVNVNATDPRAGGPADNGGINKVPGDWRETMSTHWFHDHMFSFTAANVYKGIAAMANIYSSLDRGAEDINDGVNLCLPSGRASVTGKAWGNLDYDVNLMLADKAWDKDGQLFFDIFDFDGFLGDRMTVNFAYKPYFEVERRKYRFRILNGSVSRFFKIALSDGSPIVQIGNDGNLLPKPVTLTQLDQQGIAERYDVVIDFSRYSVGQKVWMVNLAEHKDGKRVAEDLRLSEALSGQSDDPCVGKFLEFRIVRNPPQPDISKVPNTLIPNPDLSSIPVARERVFEFGRGANQTTFDPVSSFFGPWGIKSENGSTLAADYGRVSAAPKYGTREIWTLKNGGGGWDHPIHIHFEEGQIIDRDGKTSKVPAWEKGRKDVYRLRPGGSVKITIQFRDWGGMFMEHCHNTVHEDNAMLLRWEIDPNGGAQLTALPTPIPTPQGVTFQSPTEILKKA